jgi:hypothetical protein
MTVVASLEVSHDVEKGFNSSHPGIALNKTDHETKAMIGGAFVSTAKTASRHSSQATCLATR